MLIVAHRGYSSRYPENTALAFEKAIEAGADYIETDLRLSRDGVVVCCHDPDLKRIAGQTDTIAESDSAMLRNVTMADGQSLLRLDDVLAIARGRSGVMLDVKVTTDEMAERALPSIEAAGMMANVMYGTRDREHAVLMKRRAAELTVLGMPGHPAQIRDFIAAGVDAIRVWEEEMTAQIVSAVHDAGKRLWVTAGLRRYGETVGSITAERLRTLRALGADAVLVNDPSLGRRDGEKTNQRKRMQERMPS
ncbi:MAG: glycerophosphodiester phosphodiesterase family protein [Rhodospirillales bacterium]